MARQNFGFGGGANMQQLMRQAQKMQQAMTDAQEKLDAQEYEAQSGGGVVSVKVNGKRELLSLTIDPKVVDPDDGHHAAFELPTDVERTVGVVDIEMFGGQFFADLAETARLIGNLDQ